jgi:hypothetical protein
MANTAYKIFSVRKGKRILGYYEHRLVWEMFNGPIPEGHVIHHKDGNKRNNSIENLECLPKGEHHSHHMREIAREPERIERARALGKRQRTQVEIKCIQCGASAMKTTETGHGVPRFCSKPCYHRHSYNAKKAALGAFWRKQA